MIRFLVIVMLASLLLSGCASREAAWKQQVYDEAAARHYLIWEVKDKTGNVIGYDVMALNHLATTRWTRVPSNRPKDAKLEDFIGVRVMIYQ